ncbi:MAG: hypothetical protein K5882_08355 [Bacteroidales bacterium]|nr:hypothetical protein [Bacteroidales bacterium]
MKITTTAAAIMTGFGMMPQSTTNFMPFRITRPMAESSEPFVAQTSSSVIQLNIMEIYRIGVDNYLRIQEIARLKNGWDGYKARPISGSVINRTKALLMMLPTGAKVFPTSRSTMQIEYHKDAGNYFEIEVSPKTYEIYSLKGDDEFEGCVRKRDIKKCVECFLG